MEEELNTQIFQLRDGNLNHLCYQLEKLVISEPAKPVKLKRTKTVQLATSQDFTRGLKTTGDEKRKLRELSQNNREISNSLKIHEIKSYCKNLFLCLKLVLGDDYDYDQ